MSVHYHVSPLYPQEIAKNRLNLHAVTHSVLHHLSSDYSDVKFSTDSMQVHS